MFAADNANISPNCEIIYINILNTSSIERVKLLYEHNISYYLYLICKIILYDGF